VLKKKKQKRDIKSACRQTKKTIEHYKVVFARNSIASKNPQIQGLLHDNLTCPPCLRDTNDRRRQNANILLYLPWLRSGFRTDRLECVRSPSSSSNFFAKSKKFNYQKTHELETSQLGKRGTCAFGCSSKVETVIAAIGGWSTEQCTYDLIPSVQNTEIRDHSS